MQKKNQKSSPLHHWLVGIGIIFLLALLSAGAYGWFLSKEIDKRFSGRR